MSKAKAEELRADRCSPRSARTATSPARTTRCSRSRPTRSKARCARRGGPVADLDLIEINEAFAAVGVQSMRDLGVDADIVNVNGGAIALGHPIGMSGARLALTLASSSGGAAAASARRPCAAAAGRATR